MAKIFFDAATNGNPGESCCAIIIKDDNNHHIYTHYIGLLDNHSAEWAAFIRALEYARELNVTNALLYTDSKLIEDAMLKDKVKNIKFKPYLDQVKILESS
ncbi:MAG: ribonuclease HI family protein, partial [Staphylococcus lugdunensis]|nr:ribonuclease HI family protein [Staphylococcus lugdunensis]